LYDGNVTTKGEIAYRIFVGEPLGRRLIGGSIEIER
jgi:hypothetical protein